VWGPPPDRAEALNVLRTAVKLGIRHVDTSSAYGPFVANELVAEALRPYPDDLVVATKVGAARDAAGAFRPAASPAALRAQVEDDLRRLRLAALPLVYLRVGGDGLLERDETPFAESFGCLADLRERGLVRELGLSGVTSPQLEEARRIAPVTAVQNRYHLLDRGSADVLAVCERAGILFVPYFPLAAGMLDPRLDPALVPPGMGLGEHQAQTLDAVAARYGATRTQIALAWLLCRSDALLPIPGTSSVAHLRENVGALELRLGPDDVAQLDLLGVPQLL
jgi:aryl-alcohol dehydrogenase-like predicted oxidoreductase